MTALIVKLNTSGLPVPGIEKGSEQWPWICEVACELIDGDGRPKGAFNSAIRAENRRIKDAAVAVHGISNRSAARDGVSEVAALGIVCGFAAQATMLVAFNAQFCRDCIESALTRLGKNTSLLVRAGLQLVDLQQPCAALCRIPGDREDGQFRWPSLDEAAGRVLAVQRGAGPHSALSDLDVIRRLYLAMREKNVLEAA